MYRAVTSHTVTWITCGVVTKFERMVMVRGWSQHVNHAVNAHNVSKRNRLYLSCN